MVLSQCFCPVAIGASAPARGLCAKAPLNCTRDGAAAPRSHVGSETSAFPCKCIFPGSFVWIYVSRKSIRILVDLRIEIRSPPQERIAEFLVVCRGNNRARIRMRSSAERHSLWCLCCRAIATHQRDARWRGGALLLCAWRLLLKQANANCGISHLSRPRFAHFESTMAPAFACVRHSAQRPSRCFCGLSVATRQRDARWRGGVSSLAGLCIDMHPLPPARIVEFPICLRWGITNHAGIRSRARCFCGGAAGTHQRGARWRGGASHALSASSATLFHLLTMKRVSFLLADFTKCLHLRECMLKSNRHLGDFPTATGKPQTPPGWQRRPSKNGSEGVRFE